jgi:transposase
LRHWANATQAPAVLVQRAKLLLLAAEGASNTDRHRRGRPQTVRRSRRAEILATTLSPPPDALGVSHWSSRLLASELGVSHSTVARVWAEHDVKPWQTQTFKFSTDPQLDARVRDVVGLYLDPPAHAIVLCSEFLAFLKQVGKAYPRRPLHVVVDNYATHKHQRIRAWLAKHPRVRLHFTSTYGSWLNLVEVFFAIIDRQGLRRGDFASVEELVAAIGRFCDGWNQRCQPFTWTKDADQILAKLHR